ncbi:MAG: DUF2333 family protein [Porticoccaceae bacterium]
MQSVAGFGQDKKKWVRAGVAVAVVVFLLLVLVGWYWSREPDDLDIDALAAQYGASTDITGVYTTVALIGVAETLLEKSGGYISNDLMPPGVWLDNMPNWEFGVLVQVRDFSKAMRDRFSRSQSQSTEDPNLSLAEPLFNFDNESWMLPTTESEYRNGIKHLKSYLARLADDDQFNAQFYARSDNLRFWLSTAETRLGSLSQRLSASVGQRRLNTDLAGDSSGDASTQSGEQLIKTPWNELDDVFYEARGTTWALIQILRAIEQDFQVILDKKNARVSLQQIIRELEGTQKPLRSPIILNGSGFGMMANHSLAMASYISRAHAAIIDLRELLAQG